MTSGDLTDAGTVTALLVRPLTPAEVSSIPSLITQVSKRLRSKLPTLNTRMSAWETSDPPPPEALDPDVVSSAVAQKVKDYLANPEGAASRSRGDGPFTQSVSFASYGKPVGGGGRLDFNDDELAALTVDAQPYVGTVRLNLPAIPGSF